MRLFLLMVHDAVRLGCTLEKTDFVVDLMIILSQQKIVAEIKGCKIDINKTVKKLSTSHRGEI